MSGGRWLRRVLAAVALATGLFALSRLTGVSLGPAGADVLVTVGPAGSADLGEPLDGLRRYHVSAWVELDGVRSTEGQAWVEGPEGLSFRAYASAGPRSFEGEFAPAWNGDSLLVTVGGRVLSHPAASGDRRGVEKRLRRRAWTLTRGRALYIRPFGDRPRSGTPVLVMRIDGPFAPPPPPGVARDVPDTTRWGIGPAGDGRLNRISALRAGIRTATLGPNLSITGSFAPRFVRLMVSLEGDRGIAVVNLAPSTGHTAAADEFSLADLPGRLRAVAVGSSEPGRTCARLQWTGDQAGDAWTATAPVCFGRTDQPRVVPIGGGRRLVLELAR